MMNAPLWELMEYLGRASVDYLAEHIDEYLF